MKKKISMIHHSFFGLFLIALVMFFASSWTFAQEVQKVTITLGNAPDKKLTFEPKEISVKPGKVEFTLVNKAAENHNLVIKVKGEEIRLVDRSKPGESPKSKPLELAAGEYEIYCGYKSGGLHRERGMAGKLVVK